MIYESELWVNNLDRVISVMPELGYLEDKKIMITGASGLICSALADLLIRYNETRSRNISIYMAARGFEELVDRFGEYCHKEYFHYLEYDATAPLEFDGIPFDYIIHGASNASPNMIVKEPVETMMSNIVGIKNLLDYAKRNGVKRVLYISSSEVYGLKKDCQPFIENDYGYIDLLTPRNSYALAKRASETLCASYRDEYEIETVIARPGHIYGPTASPYDHRVSSAWAYAVARGNNIIMKSEGNQIRSYCYCLDCASALLIILLKGKNGCAYNISNKLSIITIKQMAEIYAKAGNVKLIQELPSDEEKKRFNPMTNSSLDSTALEDLGWKGLFTAEEGLQNTVSIIKNSYGLEMIKA